MTGRPLVLAICLGQLGNLLPHVAVPAVMPQNLMPLWSLSGAHQQTNNISHLNPASRSFCAMWAAARYLRSVTNDGPPPSAQSLSDARSLPAIGGVLSRTT